MNWADTKLDWTATDGVDTTALNRMETNTEILHNGNGFASIDTLTPDGNYVIDIGETGQTFYIGGTTYLAYITSTGRQPGCMIHLIKKTSSGYLAFAGGSPPTADDEPIYQNGAVATSPVWVAERMVTLVYDGSAWHWDGNASYF